jgi:Polysaccharide biosynthesis enzyme WcbI
MTLSQSKKIIKIAVVGNCQSRPIAAIFEKISSNVNVTVVAVVHLLESGQYEEYIQHFLDSDFIVTQLVADNYPCDFVRTSFLKQHFGSKVITIVNLFYAGYHPDWFYIRLPTIGMLKGPMGDYHNKTIFNGWKAKQPATTVASLMEDINHNIIYDDVRGKSLMELKSREAKADVKIVDFIEENHDVSPLFFIFNHPNNRLLIEYVVRILRHLELPFDISKYDTSNEPLGMYRPLVNPISRPKLYSQTLHQGIRFSLDQPQSFTITHYNSFDLVDIFYEIYDRHANMADLHNVI